MTALLPDIDLNSLVSVNATIKCSVIKDQNCENEAKWLCFEYHNELFGGKFCGPALSSCVTCKSIVQNSGIVWVCSEHSIGLDVRWKRL